MKRFIILSVLVGVMPLSLMAQDDDLYFTPKKTAETSNSTGNKVSENSTYYIGSKRDVDEYNHHGNFWSHYQKIGTDEKGNDIIQFQKGNGVYPDSTYIDTTFVGKYYDTIVDNDDYEYSQRMSRWDGFYDPCFYNYRWGFGPYWRYSWYDPWYDPWYYSYGGLYDPFYYGGFYNPWYYGYGWGYPYYYGGFYDWGYPGYGGGYIAHNRIPGRTYNSWGGSHAYAAGAFGGRSSSSYGMNGSRAYVNGKTYLNGSRIYGGRSNSRNNTNESRSIFGGRSESYQSPAQQPSFSRSSGSFGGSSSGGGGFSGGGHSGGAHGGHR